MRRQARELVAGIAGRRERLAALLDFARRQVRYVAVEVGIGGFRPHRPREVLGRGWGDCKDKALLLVELLREAGIEAYPVLIRAGAEGRVDRDFPCPTSSTTSSWRSRPQGWSSARTPRSPAATSSSTPRRPRAACLAPPGGAGPGGAGGARRRRRAGAHADPPGRSRRGGLEVELTVDRGGDARGEARLALSGDVGARPRRARTAPAPPAPIETLGRELFGRPPARRRPARPALGAARGRPAAVHLRGQGRAARPLARRCGERGGRRRSDLAAAPRRPAQPGAVAPRRSGRCRSSPRPGSRASPGSLTLPDGWCPIAAQDDEFANALGSFRQQWRTRRQGDHRAHDGGRGTVDRAAAFAALKELALAEHRGLKRRVRLECREAK